MNKKMVDEYLPAAYDALNCEGVVESGGKIKNSYRAHISTFGVMISMGSVLSAAALFCEGNENSPASKERLLLAKCIYRIIKGKGCENQNNALFKYVREEVNKNKERAVKEKMINAAIALKLAMNLYQLVQ